MELKFVKQDKFFCNYSYLNLVCPGNKAGNSMIKISSVIDGNGLFPT